MFRCFGASPSAPFDYHTAKAAGAEALFGGRGKVIRALLGTVNADGRSTRLNGVIHAAPQA
jgi:hypothetical protein